MRRAFLVCLWAIRLPLATVLWAWLLVIVSVAAFIVWDRDFFDLFAPSLKDMVGRLP